MARRRVALLVVAGALASVVAVLGSGSSPAMACSCGGEGDGWAFEHADAVFSADLIAVDRPEGYGSSTDPARWRFEVVDLYKGDVFERQVVVSEVSGASCGLEERGTGRYLVFASEEAPPMGDSPAPGPGELYAHLCGGTRALGQRPLPASFGSPTQPLAGEWSSNPASDVPWLVLGLAALVSSALAATVVVVGRARGARR